MRDGCPLSIRTTGRHLILVVIWHIGIATACSRLRTQTAKRSEGSPESSIDVTIPIGGEAMPDLVILNALKTKQSRQRCYEALKSGLAGAACKELSGRKDSRKKIRKASFWMGSSILPTSLPTTTTRFFRPWLNDRDIQRKWIMLCIRSFSNMR